VLVACWSAKGGAGTTVVAASLSLLLARRPGGALLVDLAGDLPAALGLPEPDTPGLAGWLQAGEDVPVDALARLEIGAAPGLSLLPRGSDALAPERGDVLAALLGSDARPVVADCGAGPEGAQLAVAAGATRSVLVTRACFLSLRRALAAPLQPSEVVMLVEPGRALTSADVEDVVGAPVVAELPVDPAVARAVDAGLLAARLPRTLERGLERGLDRAA
jgi:MinD-like ATPase involved in chromosome partitioning or flagellar assembly